jgi:hypothetical protein
MADIVANQKTSLPGEEVTTRAIQFFSTQNWRVTSQSARAVTLAGRIPIPWFHLLCVILGFIFCLVPGIILYFMLIGKVRKFQNMVVAVAPVEGGTDVSITCPPHAKTLVAKFLGALPPYTPPYAPAPQ